MTLVQHIQTIMTLVFAPTFTKNSYVQCLSNRNGPPSFERDRQTPSNGPNNFFSLLPQPLRSLPSQENSLEQSKTNVTYFSKSQFFTYKIELYYKVSLKLVILRTLAILFNLTYQILQS